MTLIAIYHLSIKIKSRGSGATAVGAAAYRAGEKLTNEYDGMTHDFTKKRGIAHTEILLPPNAPAEFADRSTLWNSVEKAERYKTAQLAREIEIALPTELTREQQITLARKYVQETYVNSGMCADIALHDKGDGNPHIHALLTMRPLNSDGTWGAKSRTENGRKINTVDWNDRDKAEEWRRAWAAYANGALRLAGKQTDENVLDHRSYKRQGVEQIPTVHIGPYASSLEKRGIHTELGDKNREITARNSKLRQINARLRKLEAWKIEVLAAPPTLYDVYSEITKRGGEHRSQKQTADTLQLASQALLFIEKYDVDTLADMTAAVKSLRDKYNALKAESSSTSRRYATLKEHIAQAETYERNAPLNRKYNALKGDIRDRFFNTHRDEIVAFQNAHQYFKRVLNGRDGIPLGDWKKEFAEVSRRHTTVLDESDKLAVELRCAEAIKRNTENLLGVETSARKHEVSNAR